MPNWLGDVVMATAFINAVHEAYPGAKVDLILKKGFEFLADALPEHGELIIFDKKKYGGAQGAHKFGKKLRVKKYDLFFCLPNSFSSALMARGTRAKKRVGYGNEMRSLLLTDAIKQPDGLHRVEEYVYLLEAFSGMTFQKEVSLSATNRVEKNYVVVNINSEAESRRLPVSKAVSLINQLREAINDEIILIGSPAERSFLTSVYNQLEDITDVKNLAGETSMPDLLQLLQNAAMLLTTDSGPAHVANALGTQTIVLFGAGNEHNTAPYNKENVEIIRLNQLPCEPCVKNTCKLFDQPHCLTLLDETMICSRVKSHTEKPFHELR